MSSQKFQQDFSAIGLGGLVYGGLCYTAAPVSFKSVCGWIVVVAPALLGLLLIYRLHERITTIAQDSPSGEDLTVNPGEDFEAIFSQS